MAIGRKITDEREAQRCLVAASELALVSIDNSPTEREFQNVAKLRLDMLFAGSTEGATPRLCPPWHHRQLPGPGRPRTSLPGLGLPAPWDPPRRLDLPLEAMTPAAFKKTLG